MPSPLEQQTTDDVMSGQLAIQHLLKRQMLSAESGDETARCILRVGHGNAYNRRSFSQLFLVIKSKLIKYRACFRITTRSWAKSFDVQETKSTRSSGQTVKTRQRKNVAWCLSKRRIFDKN